MPKLILDGDARGAVRAMAETTQQGKALTQTMKEGAKAAEAETQRLQNLRAEAKRYRQQYLAELKKEQAAERQAAAEKQRNQQIEFRAWQLKREMLRRMNAEVRQSKSAQEEGFGVGATSRFAAYVGGLVSVGAVVGQVTQAINAMSKASDEAAQNVVNSMGALGELQQVATSPSDFLYLLGQARQFIRGGVFRGDQLGQATDLVFALRNAQYSDGDIAFIRDLAEQKKVKPENLVNVAEGLKKYQDIFGTDEAGNITEIGRKVWSVAGTTQSDFATVAKATTLFGSEASALKFSDESALAAFAAIEKGSPGPEEAATRLRSMMTQIAKRGLSKGTLKGTVDSLLSRVRAGEKAIDILGESRAAAGLNILANPERYADFVSQEKSITAAQMHDVIGQSAYYKSDPSLAAAAALQRERGAYDSLVEEAYSPRANLADAVWAGRARRAAASGSVPWFFEMLDQYGPPGWIMLNDSVIKREARQGFPNVTQETAEDIRRHLESIDNKTRRPISGRQQ